jgi:hypothetical protein
MSENTLLEKVIRTTELGAGGGLLAPDQVKRFIDYVWDATVLAGQVRTERIRGNEAELTRIGVGRKLLRVATEAVDDGVNAGVAFSKVSLGTTKFRLDWELSEESLEDGIEGDELEDHVARLMATQIGEDLENLAINGDTTNADDPLFKGVDGWRKRGLAGGHVVDFGAAVADREVFHKALKAMPRRYMQRRNELRFFTGSNIIGDYLFSFQNVQPAFATTGALADAGIDQAVVPDGPAGYSTGNAFGFRIQEVPLFDETRSVTGSGKTGNAGEVWFTFPKNLIWGVKREVRVNRQYNQKKDTIEYTVFCRVGTTVEDTNCFVVVKNVKVVA